MMYELIPTSLNRWGLDLDKFVDFGSDGAYVMMRICNGVVTCLKNKVNPLLLSIDCVAHRTSLIFLDATNGPHCKILSTLWSGD